MIDLEYLKNEIEDCDMVLVGIGEEFEKTSDENKNSEIIDALNKLNTLIRNKNHFVISINKESVLEKSEIKKEFVCAPFAGSSESENVDDKWDFYLKWLSCTLNHKLLVLELGVLMSNPQVIRWPFEKTVMINNSAKMIRINGSIPNVPAEIGEKAVGEKENAIVFLSKCR